MNRDNTTCKISSDITKIHNKTNCKTRFSIGNDFYVYIEKKFNWFNKLMIKLVFGLEFEDVKENNNE